VLEIPAGGHVLEGTVDRPGEPVEGAADLAAATGVVLEAAPPVQTGVGVGLDLVGSRAHHHKGVAPDLVEHVVAHLGDVALPAGELPDPSPQPLDLQVVPVAGDVVGDVDIGAPQIRG